MTSRTESGCNHHLEPYLIQLIDEYVHDFRPALAARQERGLAVSGSTWGCQGQGLVQRSNHRPHLQGNRPADDSAPISARRCCPSFSRAGRLDRHAGAAAQVTPTNVTAYVDQLTTRVRSVTTYIYIYHLRRAAELVAPRIDFSWLAEVEKDLALVMEPRSKFDRLVLTQPLVEAGLDSGGRGTAAGGYGFRPRPRDTQRSDDRSARSLPKSTEEFLDLGNRLHV